MKGETVTENSHDPNLELKCIIKKYLPLFPSFTTFVYVISCQSSFPQGNKRYVALRYVTFRNKNAQRKQTSYFTYSCRFFFELKTFFLGTHPCLPVVHPVIICLPLIPYYQATTANGNQIRTAEVN